MGLFNKKGIWGGVLGPVGNSLGDIFDNGPSLLDKVNMLLTDVETEGKKQGYTRAAAEYEKAFRAIEGEYNTVKKLIEYQKNMYDSHSNALIEKLEMLEQQKDTLKKQVDQKAKSISAKYDIPVSQVQDFCASGTLIAGGPATVGILEMIYKHKERKLREAEQRGYLEAKELYETKIAKLKNDLAALKRKGSTEVKKLLNLIDEILGAIAEEQMKIAELKILL